MDLDLEDLGLRMNFNMFNKMIFENYFFLEY